MPRLPPAGLTLIGALSSVDHVLTQILKHEYRSEICTVYFHIVPVLRLHLCSVNMRKFSFPRYSCAHCVIAVCGSLNSSMCVVRLSNMAASISLFGAVERVNKSL